MPPYNISYLYWNFLILSIVVKHNDLAFLARNFKEMSAYWYSTGRMLDIPDYKLDCISNPNDKNDPSLSCLIKMLQKWANREASRATWKRVRDAARELDNNNIPNKQAMIKRIESNHKNINEPGMLTCSLIWYVTHDANNVNVHIKSFFFIQTCS